MKNNVSATGRFSRFESSGSESSDDSSDSESESDSSNSGDSDTQEQSSNESDREQSSEDEPQSDASMASAADNPEVKSREAEGINSPSLSPDSSSQPPQPTSQQSSRESSPELSGTRFARARRRKSDSSASSRSPSPESSHHSVASPPSFPATKDKEDSGSPKHSEVQPQSNTAKDDAREPHLPDSQSRSQESEMVSASALFSAKKARSPSPLLDSSLKITDRPKSSSRRLGSPSQGQRQGDRSPTRRSKSPLVMRDQSHRSTKYRNRSPDTRKRREYSPDKLYCGNSRDRHQRDLKKDRHKSRSPDPRNRSSRDSKSDKERPKERHTGNNNASSINDTVDPVLEARRRKFEQKEIDAKNLAQKKISLKTVTGSKDISNKENESREKSQATAEKAAEDASDDESDVSESSLSESESEESDDSTAAPWRSKRATERNSGDIEMERIKRAKVHRELSAEEREIRDRRRSMRRERRLSMQQAETRVPSLLEIETRAPRHSRHRDHQLEPMRSRKHDFIRQEQDGRERQGDSRRERQRDNSRDGGRKIDDSRSRKRDDSQDRRREPVRLESVESEDEDNDSKPVMRSFLNVVKDTSRGSRESTPTVAATSKPSIKDRLGIKHDIASTSGSSQPREEKPRSKAKERRVTEEGTPIEKLSPNDLRLEKLSKNKKGKKKKKRHRYSDAEDDMGDIAGRTVVTEMSRHGDARLIISSSHQQMDEEEDVPEAVSPSFHITFNKIGIHTSYHALIKLALV